MLSPQMEEAWRSDEGRRMRRLLGIADEKRHWMRKAVEKDECRLRPYGRPLLPMGKTRLPFTRASAYAFGRNIIKSILP